jgi:hypothetical protein
MSRTLLPVFEIFAVDNGIEFKEEPETFSWMPLDIQKDYEIAKSVLDNTLGAREYLKNYTDTSTDPFCDPFGLSLLGKFGEHHSGHTATHLAWSYKALLNDWDAFVYRTRRYYLYKTYKEIQLNESDLKAYTTPEELRQIFPLAIDDETIVKRLADLKKEIESEKEQRIIEEKNEYIQNSLRTLKHHYMFPDRWFDSPAGSSLFGSPENISADLIIRMSQIYPDYLTHIEKVLKAYKTHIQLIMYRQELTRSDFLAIQDYAIESRIALFDPPDITESEISVGLLRDPLYREDIERVCESRDRFKAKPI